MAWELAKNTVLRVGYGIFYAKTTNSTYYATRVENGVFQQTFNCNPTTCPALKFPNLIFTPPGGTPVAPFPGALTPVVTPFTPPSLTQTTRGQVPDWVNPLAHEGEVTIEHQLPLNMAISGSYVFGRALHLPIFVDTNLAAPSTTRTLRHNQFERRHSEHDHRAVLHQPNRSDRSDSDWLQRRKLLVQQPGGHAPQADEQQRGVRVELHAVQGCGWRAGAGPVRDF